MAAKAIDQKKGDEKAQKDCRIEIHSLWLRPKKNISEGTATKKGAELGWGGDSKKRPSASGLGSFAS